MKTFTADQFVYEPRLKTYKAIRSSLIKTMEMPDSFLISGCVGREHKTQFSLAKYRGVRKESALYLEVDAVEKELRVVVVNG